MSDELERLRRECEWWHIGYMLACKRINELLGVPAGEMEDYSEIERLRADAELGRIAMRFVDRAGDYCEVDPAQRICDEFYKAMSDAVEAELAAKRTAIDAARAPKEQGKSVTLKTDPSREGEMNDTGIYVRAIGKDGRWDSFDIAELDAQSLTKFMTSRGGSNPYAEQIIRALLGHEQAVEPVTTPDAERVYEREVP